MGFSVSAGTFDEALRLCVYHEFDDYEPVQAFPLDVEAAAMSDGPPECTYRIPVEHDDTGETLFVRAEAERHDGGWRFTYVDHEEA